MTTNQPTPSKPRLDVMIDFETAALTPDAGILSAALLPFHKSGEPADMEPYYQVVDLTSCYMAGMNMNGCQQWWTKQDAKAVAAILTAPKKPIMQVTNEIYNYLAALSETHELVLWSRGMDFDFPKLEWCIARFVEKPLPYEYWNKRDVRTWLKETGLDESQFEFEGVKHNALDDCRHQVKKLVASFAPMPGSSYSMPRNKTGKQP